MVTHRIEDALEMADRVVVLGPHARLRLELTLKDRGENLADRDAFRRQIEAALGDDADIKNREERHV